MRTYRIELERTIFESAEIELEAESEDEAREQALELAEEQNWEQADSEGPKITCVKDLGESDE